MSNRIKVVRPEKTAKTPEAISSESQAIVSESKMAAATGAQETEINKPAETGTAKSGSDKPEAMTEEMIRQEITDIIGKKERFYSRKGRVDPFEPFLRQPEPDVSTDEQAKLNRRIPRTPLEKIDLSQLRLTAVLRTPSKTRALVQESSGKGYVIGEGTYVGNKGGQVSQILKDRVMVEEKYLDVFGKISVRERELKLQQ